MEGLISAGVLLLAYVSIWAFTTWRKFKCEEELKTLVAWVVREDNDIRYNIPLWAHIKDAQLRCKIADKYRILWDEETEYVNEILSVFQKHLTQSFFRYEISHKRANELTLRTPSAKYTDFFMFRLFCFLSEHQCNDCVWAHELFGKQISHCSHGMWGSPLYDAVYELSDFGRTVQKLHYITFLSCKESDIYKHEIAGWLTPEYFTKQLDTNQIHISRR